VALRGRSERHVLFRIPGPVRRPLILSGTLVTMLLTVLAAVAAIAIALAAG
jgi:hypothetical protein